MNLYKFIGLKIKINRMSLGLSQPQLADKMGVKPLAVCRWETGERMTSLDRLQDLATIFKLKSFLELLPSKDEMKDIKESKNV